MTLLQTIMATALRGIATVLVLALPLGMLIWYGELVYLECQGQRLPDDAVVKPLLGLALYWIAWAHFLLPVGAFFHWIVARTTGVYPRWAWSSVFVGSVLLMCVNFPKGTASGAITLCFLFVLGRRRGLRGSQEFRYHERAVVSKKR